MHLALTERQIGTVTVLDLVGKLTIDHDAQRLKDKINSLIQQGRTQIVLNLTDVSYIDSGGLGQLRSHAKTPLVERVVDRQNSWTHN